MDQMRYSKTHEWAKREGDRVRVGISDYAQSQLGDVVFVELPRQGVSLRQSEQAATVESTKAASEVYTPVSGKVIEVNESLCDNPQWVNESPLDKGWMFTVSLQEPDEYEHLMDETAYKAFVAQESH